MKYARISVVAFLGFVCCTVVALRAQNCVFTAQDCNLFPCTDTGRMFLVNWPCNPLISFGVQCVGCFQHDTIGKAQAGPGDTHKIQPWHYELCPQGHRIAMTQCGEEFWGNVEEEICWCDFFTGSCGGNRVVPCN
jgi:hypothetical protein